MSTNSHIRFFQFAIIPLVAAFMLSNLGYSQVKTSTPQGTVLSADFMRDFSDDFEVFKLGSGVNSEFNEYNPVMSYDGIYMLYTSRSYTTTGKKLDGDDGQFRENINLARLNAGRFSQDGINGQPLETFVSNVNTDKHEAQSIFQKMRRQ